MHSLRTTSRLLLARARRVFGGASELVRCESSLEVLSLSFVKSENERLRGLRTLAPKALLVLRLRGVLSDARRGAVDSRVVSSLLSLSESLESMDSGMNSRRALAPLHECATKSGVDSRAMLDERLRTCKCSSRVTDLLIILAPAGNNCCEWCDALVLLFARLQKVPNKALQIKQHFARR